MPDQNLPDTSDSSLIYGALRACLDDLGSEWCSDSNNRSRLEAIVRHGEPVNAFQFDMHGNLKTIEDSEIDRQWARLHELEAQRLQKVPGAPRAPESVTGAVLSVSNNLPEFNASVKKDDEGSVVLTFRNPTPGGRYEVREIHEGMADAPEDRRLMGWHPRYNRWVNFNYRNYVLVDKPGFYILDGDGGDFEKADEITHWCLAMGDPTK